MEKEYAKYLLKKTKDNYNLIADDFSRTRSFLWPELNSLKDYLIDGEKILDLGCGNGRLYELFKNRNIDYYGVDISEKLIEIAKTRYPKAKFQVTDPLNLPFPGNFFDKIFSIAVLHHIPSIEFRLQFLKEARRILKPEGTLILLAWNLRQWKNWKLLLKFTFLKILGKSKLDFNDVFIPWRKTIKRYIHCFTLGELKNLTKKAGFKIEEAGFASRGNTKNANIYLIAEK